MAMVVQNGGRGFEVFGERESKSSFFGGTRLGTRPRVKWFPLWDSAFIRYDHMTRSSSAIM